MFGKTTLAASLVLASVISLPAIHAADAVPTPTPEPPAKSNTATASKDSQARRAEAIRGRRDAALAELGLSDEQRDKLRAAMKDQGEKVRAIREDASLTSEQRAAKSKEVRESFTAQAKTIMTPEQFEKWQKLQQDRLQRAPRPAPGPKPEPTKPEPTK